MKKNTLFPCLKNGTKSIAIISLLLLLFSFKAHSQVFWNEDFGLDLGGCSNQGITPDNFPSNNINGPWTLFFGPSNDPTFANQWFASATEAGMGVGNCGDGCINTGTLSNQTLHIGMTDLDYDPGAAYDNGALCGFGICPVTDERAETPTINCTGQSSINLAFNYLAGGDPGHDYCNIEYSINNGATWLFLAAINPTNNASCGGQGLWTAMAPIALPVTCNNNPTVKIGFHWVDDGDGVGNNPSVAIDDITLSTPPSSNSITTGLITGGPFCACNTITVPFTSVGGFNASNTYTAQLSNSAGSFASPVNIGSITSSANSGNITCTIPCNTPAGAGYFIQVISTSPVASTIISNGVGISITAQPIATFNYNNPTNNYCVLSPDPSPNFTGGGTAGTFTSTPAGLQFVFPIVIPGQVDVSASTVGTYTITNTVGSAPCSPVSATAVIHITTSQNPSFSYSASTYCQSAPNPPAPNITGVTGGHFRSTPTGLDFDSTNTGQIFLATSALHTFTIWYITPGPCKDSTSHTITITAAPDATFSYTGSPYCSNASNQSPTFPAGASAGTFSSSPPGLVWTSGLPTSTTGIVNIAASTPGTYTITNNIVAANGCSASTINSTITITQVQNPAFTYASHVFCQGGPNPLPTISGNAGGSFHSSPSGLVFIGGTPSSTGQIDLVNTPLNTTYTITYLNSGAPNTCPDSATWQVTVILPPVATFSYPVSPICKNATNPSPSFTVGSPGTFSATPSGLSFVSTATGVIDLASSAAGTYTVKNLIGGTGGCPADSATTIITITAPPIAGFTYTGSPYCLTGVNPSATLATGASAANGIFSAVPAGLSFLNTTSGLVNLSASAAGTYTVTHSYPPAGGCLATSAFNTITITAPPIAAFNYSSISFCSNASNPSPTLSGLAGTFSSTPNTLVFMPITPSSPVGTINLSASPAGFYTVTNTIPPTGGCPATTASVAITIVAAPNAAVNSTSICLGHAASLVATPAGASSYTWLGGATTTGANTATASPTNNTTYSVIVTSNGCPDTAVSTITVVDCHLLPVIIADDTSLCLNGCVNFTDGSTGNPTSWTWTFPGGTPATGSGQGPINVCYPSTGHYTVILNILNSVSDTTLFATNYINVWDPIPVQITPQDVVINACESAQLTANPAGKSYLWGPEVNLECDNCQTATVKPTATQQYYVNYTDKHGCFSADTTTVNVENLFTYFMPTGFSPNGDGINDMLVVHGRGIDYILLKIFDRVGEQVFQTSSLDEGWDGTLHGVPMNNNVFAYDLEVTFCNGDKKSEKGNLTLVR